MIGEYQIRRDLVMSLLAEIPGVECLPPQGAFYVFPDVSALYTDSFSNSVDFAEMLLNEGRVAVVPGVAFGADRHIRLSFACSREHLTEGLERIREAVGRVAEIV